MLMLGCKIHYHFTSRSCNIYLKFVIFSLCVRFSRLKRVLRLSVPDNRDEVKSLVPDVNETWKQ